MAYNPNNPNGQETKANSAPVVIASDQGTLPVKETVGAAVTGTITANAQTVVLSLDGAASALLVFSGTYAGHVLVFEASYDNTTWVLVIGTPESSPTATPATGSTPSANQTFAFHLGTLAGFNYVRVRATAYTSGTMNVVLAPIAVSMSPVVSGSVNANISPNTTATGLTTFSNQNLSDRSLVKATLVRIFEWDFYNPTAVGVWVQIFNASTTAGVTLGSTVPIRTVYIPAGSGRDHQHVYGMAGPNGCVIACTTTALGATLAGPISVYMGYV